MNAHLQAWSGSMRTLALALAIALASIAAPAPSATAETAIAVSENGPVEGLVTPTLHKFLGIPYAAPPVGALRWQPPQPHTDWVTPIDATQFGNHCPQATSPFGLPTETEDCLFLNVYTPNHNGFASDVHHHKPVMVWIHGGALVVGESDDYDPTKLVTGGDVVVVTLNYRLGALGFLAHPALTAESPDNASGNYGLMDQQLALQWVQRNIAAFGGNPHKVTIFGESAGGLSVHSQLASPLAAGLFKRAIVQSGAYQLTQPTLADGEAKGTAFATAAGCNDQTVACLRALPVAQILANQGNTETSTSPVIDGKVLTQSIKDAFTSGQFNRVPVMEGANHDEFRLFVALQFELVDGPITADDYPNVIQSTLGIPPDFVSLFTSQYPLGDYASPGIAFGALLTDAAFTCNARTVSQLLSQYVRTYAYEFNDENAPELFLPPVSFPYGAAHASEIQYLFDVITPFPGSLDADQQALSNAMVGYWTRFARSGRPKSSQGPVWPRYRSDDRFLSLEAPSPILELPQQYFVDHKCYFWASLPTP
jgi:para-nitrobenzyl esterase